MKKFIVALAVLAVVAAGWFLRSRPTQTVTSGITGTVLLGPTCPVVRNPPDPQCADKPYRTTLAVTTVDGARVVTTFTSDSNGTFSVQVPPGEYAIRSAAASNILPYCSDEHVVVRASAYTTTTVRCDTGIR